MRILAEIEWFFSGVVYPNRFLFGALSAVLMIAVGVFLHRRGAVAWLNRHRRAALIGGVPALLVAGMVGYVLISPLWERSELNEESPLARAAPTATAGEAGMSHEIGMTPAPSRTPGTAVFSPALVADGDWRGADEFHFARGRALVIETAPGQYTVRVEDFSVRNGPDLFVYLSPSADGFADGALNLGSLKATDGAFNYEVPPGADVTRFKSVVVWCRAFGVLFGTATLGASM